MKILLVLIGIAYTVVADGQYDYSGGMLPTFTFNQEQTNEHRFYREAFFLSSKKLFLQDSIINHLSYMIDLHKERGESMSNAYKSRTDQFVILNQKNDNLQAINTRLEELNSQYEKSARQINRSLAIAKTINRIQLISWPVAGLLVYFLVLK